MSEVDRFGRKPSPKDKLAEVIVDTAPTSKGGKYGRKNSPAEKLNEAIADSSGTGKIRQDMRKQADHSAEVVQSWLKS